MKLSKSDFTGTGKVFEFTLVQFLKTKANVVSMVILLIFSLASVPVMSLIGGGGAAEKERSELEKVYFENTTEYDITEDAIAESLHNDEYFLNVDLVKAEQSLEVGENEVFVHLAMSSDGAYTIEVKRSTESAADEDDIERLKVLLTEVFNTARYRELNVTEEQLNILTAPYEVQTQSMEEYLETEEDSVFSTQYWLQLVYAIVVMMVSIFAVSYIIRAVVEEKASKLVELLMVNVRPLALIVGKVLAAMVYTLCTFGVMIIGFAASYIVSKQFLNVSAIGDMLDTYGISFALMNFNPMTLFTVVFSLLLGYVTFSILAGLSGTGCSATEDMGGAQTLSMTLIMAGYIFSIIAGATENSAIIHVCCLVPVLSVYCAPVQYMVGGIGIGTLCLAWVLQIAVIMFLALFTARVYESLLMHRGTRVTFKQMFAMAKQTKAKEAN